MTESHQDGHEDQKQVSGDAQNAPKGSEKDGDIIELSDIAIGITQEDDLIVELTEEIIGEAFVGFSGATSEVIQEDEQVLDLSQPKPEGDESPGATASQENVSEPTAVIDEHAEEEISRELDHYFGTEEDLPPVKKPLPDGSQTVEPPAPLPQNKRVESFQAEDIRISSHQLDDAVERVIRKMFAEKINRILDDVIERTVSEEISQLRDYLLGVSGKK